MNSVYVISVVLAWLSLTSGLYIEDEEFGKLIDKVSRLERTNAELEDKVKDVKSQCSTRDRRLIFDGEPPVAFTYLLCPAYVDHMNPNQKIIFDQQLTNIGAGYSNQTGVFTAPFSGIYLFSASLLDNFARTDGTGSGLHAEIVQNGNALARIFAHAEGVAHRDQGAQTIFAQVTQGDRVWVRIADSTDVSVGGILYSSFSGYLLYPN